MVLENYKGVAWDMISRVAMACHFDHILLFLIVTVQLPSFLKRQAVLLLSVSILDCIVFFGKPERVQRTLSVDDHHEQPLLHFSPLPSSDITCRYNTRTLHTAMLVPTAPLSGGRPWVLSTSKGCQPPCIPVGRPC
mmetsp:Transcript_21861/g.46135  ORF Transcript_21861/g.46135 Transcript_21861/m.46135 type:complete len:136 (-) Transcript_21861:912-1319(-)